MNRGVPGAVARRRRLRPRRRREWLGLALVIGVMVAGAGSVLAFGMSARPVEALKGPAGAAPSQRSASPVETIVPEPKHEVYGFVPYWEIDDGIAAHLRATRTTTVALFSITHTKQGRIATNLSGYRRIDGPIGRRIIADAHARDRRVDVTWTSFGAAKNRALFASEELQDKVIAALVDARADLGVDGIAVDVEGIDPVDVPALGAFVGRLRTALVADHPDGTITVAAGAGPGGAAIALAAQLAGADRIFLMGYDYRTRSSNPGASAPLSRSDGDERSLTWSLDLYQAAGVDPERLLLGLPLYGLSWPTEGGELGASSTGRGDVWVPRRNLAQIADATTTDHDLIEEVAFLSTADGAGFRSVYYDTPDTLRPKLALANEHGFAGAGFWALGYERGLPGYTELITDFGKGRSMGAPATP